MLSNKSVLSLAVASALALSGCGGSSSDSSDPTTYSLSGTSAKGIIKYGVVTVEELVNDEWTEVGSGSTDENGDYSLDLSGYQNGVVKLTITASTETTMICDDTGGCDDSTAFGEEMSLASYSSDFEMTALLASVDGGGISGVPVTPYTHMASALFEASDTRDSSQAETAISEVSALVGYDVSTTAAVDITSDDFSDASTSEQWAAVLGAAVMELTDDETTITDVLDELESTFSDGDFDSDDEVTISELVEAWEETVEAIEESDTVEVDVDDSVITNIEVLVEVIETATETTDEYDPEASEDYGDSDIDQAKDLISDTRDLYNNIVDSESDLSDFVDNLSDAADVFDQDTAAIFELAAVAFEEVIETFETEGDTLLDEMDESSEGTTSRTLSIELDGESVGDLTLSLSSDSGFAGQLSGSLTGTSDDAVTVSFDDIALSTNLALADLIELASEQSSYTFAISGSLSDGSTSIGISDGELVAVTDSDISEETIEEDDVELSSLSLNDLTLDITADDSSFTGSASIEMVAPEDDSVSSYIDFDWYLAINSVALSGSFTTADGDSIEGSVELDLEDSDTFDLLSFLNQDSYVDVDIEDYLTDTQIADLNSLVNVDYICTEWTISYWSEFAYIVCDGDGSIYGGDLDTLNATVNPTELIEELFSSNDIEVYYAEIELDSEGNNQLSGEISLGDYQESDDSFQQIQITLSTELSLESMPSVSFSAVINRDLYEGGSASAILEWDGEQYTYTLENIDWSGDDAFSTDLTITNPDGVSLTLNGSWDDELNIEGDLTIGDNEVASVETLSSGVVKVSYSDGTFETFF